MRIRQLADAVRSNPQEGTSNINYSYELDLLRRERLLLQCEIDIRKKNEMLRMTSLPPYEIEQSRKPSVKYK